MGFGDEIMGSGVARGAAARGKRIAFGDGRRIIWNEQNAWSIFRGNPNVAPPGSEGCPHLEWVEHYPGKRLYHRGRTGHIWLYSRWRATPGEIFLTASEAAFGADLRFDVVIEPNVKKGAPNKQWGFERYEEVARQLARSGLSVAQLLGNPGQRRLENAAPILTPTFRHALAILSRAGMYVGPEGGLHHGAAAFGVPGVVVFGGFTHPRNTGYDIHENIFVGDEPCGRQDPCPHCKAAMDSIGVDRVVHAAEAVHARSGGKASLRKQAPAPGPSLERNAS